jgi:uncharacterized membrane protein
MMPSLFPPPVALSQVGRAAHDLGLAGLLGGQLFGRIALHPSVTAISDEAERGEVVNAAWRRYGAINLVSIAAVTAGWAGARVDESADRYLSPRERTLARAKDVLVAAAAVTGLATAAQGMRFSKMAPDGAVPLTDGDHTAPSAGAEAAAAKRRVQALGTASIIADVGLVAVNSALAQRNYRRPPARRMLPGFGRR